ncbi:MAG: C40 family peptidase [Gorillibacterium sp.]|nr:C40 family peptidase [Gorillibacterium sp.]
MQVNDDLLHFPDAKPFLDKNNRTQVPIRIVSEKMGYSVSAAPVGNEVKITIQNDVRKVVLQTGQDHAEVNGESVPIDTKAVVTQGRAYVPVRFISESFDTVVKWDSKNELAIVNADGKDHAPILIQKDDTDVLINSAKKYVGIAYKWGGTSPNGFDCSGFVQFVYKLQSITLPRTSNNMLTSSGTKVFKPEIGDLVFFSDNKKAPATHVGIFVGDGKFISSTTSSGVRVDVLTSGYWGNRYFAAKRIL